MFRILVCSDGAYEQNPGLWWWRMEEIFSMCSSGQVALWLRELDLSDHSYYNLASRVRSEARSSNVALVLRGRVEMAKALGVGVHLPEDGMPPTDARSLLGSGSLIGRSCHHPTEIPEMDACDYVTLSPFWETSSKPGAPGIYADLDPFHGEGPAVYALGGVRPDRVARAQDLGCAGVAVRSYVWDSDDPAQRIVDLLEQFPENPID